MTTFITLRLHVFWQYLSQAFRSNILLHSQDWSLTSTTPYFYPTWTKGWTRILKKHDELYGYTQMRGTAWPQIRSLLPLELHWIEESTLTIVNSNNNNARTLIFMVLSSCLKHCESSPWFTWWMQHGARWSPTFGPSRSAWTISPAVGCQLIHSPSIFYYYSARKLKLILPSHTG